MADLVYLENLIKQLSPSDFQRLGDFIMLHRGANNLNSLGNVAGKRKTRKGTPDSFYFDNVKQKYVFCEYTTELNKIVTKFAIDVQKCLDKANKCGIKLSEIIFIHSTNDLEITDEKEMRKCCEKEGILLSTIGLTQLVYMVNESKSILRDFFSIDETNKATMSLEEFVYQNSAQTSGNMSYKFIGREQEIGDIIQALTNNKYVFVTGESGVGKSRLVVEALTKVDKKIICVNKYFAKTTNSLLDSLDDGEEAIIFVDDINQLAYAREIIGALSLKSYINVKLIATIRKYALPSIISIFDDDRYELIEIGSMSSDDIKEVLRKNLNIINPKFLDRILEIANGNVRIALLAGEESLVSGLLSLYNSESLLANYYKRKIAERFGDSYHDYLKTLFAIAFLNKIDLEHLDKHKQFFDYIGVSEDEIKQKSVDLTRLEVFKTISNRIVSVDDQCLDNYIIYDSFIASKVFGVGDFVKKMFKNYSSQIVTALNVIVRVYTSKYSADYIKNEILSIWNYFKGEGGSLYDDFVLKFSSLNEDEAIYYCADKLFKSNQYKPVSEYTEFEKPLYSANPYISILESIESPASIHYLFKALNYSSIRNNAFSAIENLLNIEAEDFSQEFSRFYPLLKEIKRTKGKLFNALMVLASSKIHQFHFSYSSYKKERQFVHYSLELKDEYQSIVPLRHELWKLASSLSDLEKYQLVLKYFSFYPSKETKQIFSNDLCDIEELLNSISNKQPLYEIDLYVSVMNHLKRTGVPWPFLKEKHKKEIDFLTMALCLRKEEYDVEGQARVRQIDSYLSKTSFKQFVKDIDLLTSFKEIDKDRAYKVNNYLASLLDRLNSSTILTYGKVILLRDSLISKSVLATFASKVIKETDDPYSVLQKVKCKKHDELIALYFEQRAQNGIIDDDLKEHFNKFVSTKEKESSNCFDDIRPSTIWKLLEGEEIVDLISYVFKTMDKRQRYLPTLLDLLFNPYSEPAATVIFKTFLDYNRLDDLFDIFVFNSFECKEFYGASDYTFAFASIDVKYLKELARKQAISENHIDCYTFKGLWKQPNCRAFVKIIFDEFVNNHKYVSLGSIYLKHILDLDSITEEQQQLFIDATKDLYESYSKNEAAILLLKTIVNETNDSIKIDFIIYLISLGMSAKELSHYDFFTSVESYSDSYVPIVNKKIRFFEKLREEINKDPELIEYSRCITDLINNYNQFKEEVKAKEAIDGLY